MKAVSIMWIYLFSKPILFVKIVLAQPSSWIWPSYSIHAWYVKFNLERTFYLDISYYIDICGLSLISSRGILDELSERNSSLYLKRFWHEYQLFLSRILWSRSFYWALNLIEIPNTNQWLFHILLESFSFFSFQEVPTRASQIDYRCTPQIK